MRLQFSQISFKPTFIFMLYASYVLGLIGFTAMFLLVPSQHIETALLALPIYFVAAPAVIAISIFGLNLLMRTFPWKVTLIMLNVDEQGNIVATSRHIRTIRTARNQSIALAEPKAAPALEPGSEIFPGNSINDDDDSGSQPLYGQQSEIRESSDEYKAVTDQLAKKKAENEVPSDDYRASTDRSEHPASDDKEKKTSADHQSRNDATPTN